MNQNSELDQAEKQDKHLSRRGLERYRSNPFVGNALASTKSRIKKITNGGNRAMVIMDNTGEVLGPAGFWQSQEVDQTQFVKLYVNGVRAFKELTGAGTKVFELLYLEVQKNIGSDQIYLSFQAIDQKQTPMGKTTFMKGMKELVLKEFIAESYAPNMYFLNPDFMWNGDRLAFVKEYTVRRIEQAPKLRDTFTGNLFENQSDEEKVPAEV